MYKNQQSDILDALIDNSDKDLKLSAADKARLDRLKDAHTYWLGHPVISETMMRDYLMSHYGIGRTQAYSDIAIIKAAFGNVSQGDKEFQRFRANHILEQATAAALAGNDKKAKALTKIAEAIGRVNQLDKPEGERLPWDEIVPQDISVTVDPTVIGIEKEPNIEVKARKLLERYTKDVEPEEEDGIAEEVSE